MNNFPIMYKSLFTMFVHIVEVRICIHDTVKDVVVQLNRNESGLLNMKHSFFVEVNK